MMFYCWIVDLMMITQVEYAEGMDEINMGTWELYGEYIEQGIDRFKCVKELFR